VIILTETHIPPVILGFEFLIEPPGALKKWWQEYSLSINLFLLFFVSWVGQGYSQWQELAQEALAHNQPFGWSDFWAPFFAATFENWPSEFLQLLTFVVLTAFLIHRGSHESKDGDDEIRA
jgi:hypothetical protein